ncbi:MAG: hypothetical protein ACK4FN_02835 [Acinetobacter johnsonii]
MVENIQMSDPHAGMTSFQECLLKGVVKVEPVTQHIDLYSYVDVPEPGVNRLTYARLDKNQKIVKAFLSCVPNGQFNGHLCIAVGYAVPEKYRNLGYAKNILRDVVQDLIFQASRNGKKVLVIEAVIDQLNLASQRVAETVLQGDRECITDSISQKAAFRYTATFNTADGSKI